MSVAIEFSDRYNRIEKVIPFNDDWFTGPDHFYNAVMASSGISVVLEPGEEAKSISPMPSNKKMIFMGTPLGTLVVYQCYCNGEWGVLIHNASTELDQLKICGRGEITQDKFAELFGWSASDNLGSRLAKAFL